MLGHDVLDVRQCQDKYLDPSRPPRTLKSHENPIFRPEKWDQASKRGLLWIQGKPE